MSRQDKAVRYVAAAKAVAKAVAEAAVAEAAVAKAVDAADLGLFPHAKAVALEKLKAEMKKHGDKTGTGRNNCR